MNIIKNTSVVIVDFDNFFRMNEPSFNSSIFELHLKDIVEEIALNNATTEDILIRLYGGWYMGAALTNNASRLQQMLSRINVFPYIKNLRKVSGSIEMVSSLLEVPDFIWTSTYKEKNGINKVRVKSELLTNTCECNPYLCPPKILSRFTKSRTKLCTVEGCTIVHSQVIRGMEQKMVDTIMACDIVSCGEEDLINEIVIASDDTDLLPSILLVKNKSQGAKSVTLFNKKQNVFDNWQEVLRHRGINVKLIEL